MNRLTRIGLQQRVLLLVGIAFGILAIIEKAGLEAGLSGSGRVAFQEAFESLAAYTQKHFSDEEADMASIGYLGLDRHKQAHRSLLESVSQFGQHAASGQVDGRALMDFLSDWLMRHVLGSDMDYAKLANKS